jgi:chemotaxis protein methyltransferase CheR
MELAERTDGLTRIGDKAFDFVASFVYDRFGIRFTDEKRILLEGRLGKRLRALGLGSFDEYCDLVRMDESGEETVELLNLVTTNHTFFFREGEHFDFLSGVALPEARRRMARSASYPFRIWSAGCATGEEAYSIAIALLESFGPEAPARDIGILGTDISTMALDNARKGLYQEARLGGLSKALRDRYLAKARGGSYEVRAPVRELVLFKRLNLMEPRFPFRGCFDVIFCRNVMIYFDAESRDRLIDSLFAVTKPGGYLFIGHSESLRRESCPFEYVSPAIYKRAEG